MMMSAVEVAFQVVLMVVLVRVRVLVLVNVNVNVLVHAQLVLVCHRVLAVLVPFGACAREESTEKRALQARVRMEREHGFDRVL